MIKTYRPVTCNCTQYIESDVSATLALKYHYGAGGDGALIVQIYDARGNGEGGVSPTITGDHQNRITDYTAIVLLALGGTDSHASVTDGTVAPCMLARAGTGGGQ